MLALRGTLLTWVGSVFTNKGIEYMKLQTIIGVVLFAFITSAYSQTPPPDTVSSSAGNIRIERLATLELPWGMALLPDGRLLITEKPGRRRIWATGKLP